jgi:hypothetical protein
MATDTRLEPWRVEKGERKTATFPVLFPDATPFPIDGWTVTATIYDRPAGTVLYTVPSENVTIDPDENTIRLVIPAPVSAAWTWWTGWYQVVISDPGSDPDDPSTFRVLNGVFVVDP